MTISRTRAPSATSGTDVLLALLIGAIGAALTFGLLAWITGNLTNSAIGAGPWAPFRVSDALLHPEVLWPHLGSAVLLIGTRVIPGLLTAGLLVAVCLMWLRLRGSGTNGLAGKADLAPLLGKEITGKARSLRPSLAGRERKRDRPR